MTEEAMNIEAIRARVAVAKGLSPEQAAYLRGSTELELRADADALRAEFGMPAPAVRLTPSGSEAGSGTGAQSGEARYREKYPNGGAGQSAYRMER
jgi:hypothetical protein